MNVGLLIALLFFQQDEASLCLFGALLGVALFVLVRLLLPVQRRKTLNLPFFGLLLYGLVVVGWFLLPAGIFFNPLTNIFHVTAFFLIAMTVGRLGFLLGFEVLVAKKIGKPLPKITTDILQGLVYAGVFIITLREAGVQLSSLLVTSAFLTAVIGLALQETLGNLFAGLTLQAQQPFEIGDWIQLEGYSQIGEVVEINWRATKTITLDRVEVIVPNGVLAKNSIINYTKPTHVARRNIYIFSPYKVAPQTVHDIILNALAETPEVLKTPAPTVVTNRFLDNGMTEYWVRFFIEAFDRRDIIDGRVRDRIWYALDRQEIEPPYGTTTILLHQMDEANRNHLRENEIKEVEKYLGLIAFLRPLTKDAIQQLSPKVRKKRFAPGEVIIREGDEGDEFFIIHQGVVSIEIGGVEVSRMDDGSFFGEMSLLTGEPRSATVIATEEVELYAIDSVAFREILLGHPDLAEEMSRTLATRQLELERIHAQQEISEEAVTKRTTQLLTKIKRFFFFS